MADKYKSTLLAQNNTPEEIQKADLDLLKKINEVQKNVESISIPEKIENENVSEYFRQAFYRYNTKESLQDRYVHLKTNQTINNVMFCVKFNGYAYGENKPIDATVVGYPYRQDNDIIQIGTYGSHVCGAYKSADDKVVLTIYLTRTYFVGFLLDQIGAGPQGMFPLHITDTSLSTLATGVY